MFYKKMLEKHFSNMQEIAKSVEIVSKFSNVSTKFKNGEWLEAFANSPIKDPVAYAVHHKIKIEGKNALDWANINNYKIPVYGREGGKNIKQQQWGKNIEGKWREQTTSIFKREKIIEGLTLEEYTPLIEKRLK